MGCREVRNTDAVNMPMEGDDRKLCVILFRVKFTFSIQKVLVLGARPFNLLAPEFYI
jgi:hypothetical protein